MRREDVRPGMRVVVTRSAPRYEDGWDNSWITEMDRVVGMTLTVRNVHPTAGVSFHEVACAYPWSVLEPAFDPRELARPLTDGALHGPTLRDRTEVRRDYPTGPADEATTPSEYVRLAEEGARHTAAHDRRREYVREREIKMLRVQNNLAALKAGNPAVWRMAGELFRSNVTRRRRQYQQWGETVRGFMNALREDSRASALDHDELVTFLNDVRGVGRPWLARKLFNVLDATTKYGDLWGYVRACDDCGEWDLDDNMTSVHSGNVVCGSCLNNNYIESSEMGEWLSSGEARPVYRSARAYHHSSPDDHVTRSYGMNHFYAWNDGACFLDEDAYYEMRDEDDEDDGYRASGGSLDEYHRASRDFSEVVTKGSPYPALGVELEVYCENRPAAVKAVRALQDRHICERDGSLSDDYGFEVVTRPFGKPQWGDATGGVAQRLLDVCKAHEVLGYNAKRGMYGIHVTVHRRHLSPLQEARIMMFLTATENGAFVRAIAQRMKSYGDPDVDMGNLPKSRQKVSRIGGLRRVSYYDEAVGRYRYMTKICGVGKYGPLNFKDHLAEFRLFQSTTYLPSFMKNLEFVWALIEWTATGAATGKSWHHEDFMRWLGARPDARKDYPNLLEYVQRVQYRVKGGIEPIRNTWLPALTSAMLTSKLGELPEILEDDSEAQHLPVVSTEKPVPLPEPAAATPPAEDWGPWIDWAGGPEMPAAVLGRRAEVRLHNGRVLRTDSANNEWCCWDHQGDSGDIVAYRVFGPAVPTPAQRARRSSWTEWLGGEMPVPPHGTRIDVRYRNGAVARNVEAGGCESNFWGVSGMAHDIVAWRRAIPARPRDAQGRFISTREVVECTAPAPDLDGWIEWHGGDCPVSGDTRVRVRLRSDTSDMERSGLPAGDFRWDHRDSYGDIVAYRVAPVIEPFVFAA